MKDGNREKAVGEREMKMWRKKMKIINEYYQGQWKAYYMCMLGRIFFSFPFSFSLSHCNKKNTEFFILIHFHHLSVSFFFVVDA